MNKQTVQVIIAFIGLVASAAICGMLDKNSAEISRELYHYGERTFEINGICHARVTGSVEFISQVGRVLPLTPNCQPGQREINLAIYQDPLWEAKNQLNERTGPVPLAEFDPYLEIIRMQSNLSDLEVLADEAHEAKHQSILEESGLIAALNSEAEAYKVSNSIKGTPEGSVP